MHKDEVVDYALSHDMMGKDQHKDQKETAGRSECCLQCKFCGKVHTMRKEECPAWGKTCMSCGGRNNFAAVCGLPKQPKQQVKVVQKYEKGESSE